MSIATRFILGSAFVLAPTVLVSTWILGAKGRLAEMEQDPNASATAVAIASVANEGYCSGELKKVLRRVLLSCGLAEGDARGCQPVEARKVATMAGNDFNALFSPLSERASIIQFDKDQSELDETDRQLLDNTFSDQRGASYFFVVARSSPDGSVEHNRTLSQGRAETVMAHLRSRFNDPELDKQVGLLWLGEEFAQLDDTFCQWTRSGSEECSPEHLNRSAFVAWIDCRL
jgi:outer membrane protein OmpA-like peptidoglycan-associated protein